LTLSLSILILDALNGRVELICVQRPCTKKCPAAKRWRRRTSRLNCCRFKLRIFLEKIWWKQSQNRETRLLGITMRKFSTIGLLVLCMFALSGCVIYLDRPPVRTISGQVVRADTGQPVPKATIFFHSGRKPFSLLPVDTFGIDASAFTDQHGRFTVTARLKDKVNVTVQNEIFWEAFTLPPFPPSNELTNQLWKLSQKISDLHARGSEKNQ